MIIDGAVIREQGQVFGIIIVKQHILSYNSTANETRTGLQSKFAEFQGMPLVLACQDGSGTFSYNGRPDIVKFLASISPSRIPWKRYIYNG